MDHSQWLRNSTFCRKPNYLTNNVVNEDEHKP